jgi:uncharacterized membrane protein YfcA
MRFLLMSSIKSKDSRRKNLILLWIVGVFSFLLCGAICAFIAYDNKMITPNDTPAELAEHTRELKVVLISSFIGGGFLGGIFGAGGFWVVRRGNSDNEPIDHEDEVA